MTDPRVQPPDDVRPIIDDLPRADFAVGRTAARHTKLLEGGFPEGSSLCRPRGIGKIVEQRRSAIVPDAGGRVPARDAMPQQCELAFLAVPNSGKPGRSPGTARQLKQVFGDVKSA